MFTIKLKLTYLYLNISNIVNEKLDLLLQDKIFSFKWAGTRSLNEFMSML